MTAFMVQPTPDDRATQFQAVKDTGAETYNGYSLMVTAYALIWVILMGWLVMLWRRQAALSTRVVDLEAALDRAEKRLQKSAPAKPKATESQSAEPA